MRFIRSALVHAAIFAFGAITAVSCYGLGDYGNPAFRCAPSEGADGCPDGYTCCSDDPATQMGLLPAYRGTPPGGQFGVPIFSENNNVLSTQGMCVEVKGIVNPLLNGCPVPCNPTWDAGKVNSICSGALCCQTELLEDKDCIQDPMTGLWRAYTGADILAGLTAWGPALGTNQDPVAAGCGIFAGTTMGDVFNDCITQLSVANQRGFCNASCPCVEDTCALKNPGAVPKCGLAPAG
ncbi:MAG: hypothetical protein R3B09_08420 [Nannocystaceae bacterium]